MRYIQLLFFYILFSFGTHLAVGSNGTGGLIFRAYEYSKDERTSFIIPSKKQELNLKNYLSLSFDLRIKPEGEHFGYVCRILIGNQSNINLMLINPVNEDPYLCFIKDQQYLGKVRFKKDIDIYKWNTIKVELEVDNDTLYVKQNGIVIAKDGECPPNRLVRICFGANDTAPFSTSDVAPMILKNVAIGLKNEQTTYFWPLEQAVSDTLLQDQSDKLTAFIANPEWIINQHMHWHQVRTIKFSSKTYPVPDKISGAFFFVSKDNITKLDLNSNTLKEYPLSSSVDVDRLTNQFIAIPGVGGKSRIAYYDFDKPDGENLSFFDFETGGWSMPIKRSRQSSCIQHSKFFSPQDSSIVQLLGYGFHSYTLDLNRVSLSGEIVRSQLSKVIAPRYLSAIGVVDSAVYIYGGLGNDLGKQEYGVTNYRDLYKLNLKDYSLEKKWAMASGTCDEVAASTLIIDSTETHAKGLFFNPSRFLSKLVMKDLNLITGEEKALGDTIPYTFLDVSSYADLLYLPSHGRYYAVTVHQSDPHTYEATIYSIAAPVLPLATAVDDKNSWLPVGGILAAVLAGIISVIMMWMRRAKNQRKIVQTEVTQTEPLILSENPHLLGEEEGQDPEFLFNKMGNTAPNTTPGIYMLNGFQVIDKESKDITGKFTPIMRQLLSVIILYSNRNHKGISNVKLKELLWFDKSEESFSNNRSVNIRKIRLLLEEVGNTEISAANGYWYFLNEGHVYNDYMTATRLLNKMMPQSVVENDDMEALLNLASYGQLLPNMQFDWIDDFKADYSDSMIGLLSKLRDSKQFDDNDKLKVLISNCILRFDSLDEESVRVKCRSLVAMKRMGIAHATFDQFTREYRLILNEDFEDSFELFIHV